MSRGPPSINNWVTFSFSSPFVWVPQWIIQHFCNLLKTLTQALLNIYRDTQIVWNQISVLQHLDTFLPFCMSHLQLPDISKRLKEDLMNGPFHFCLWTLNRIALDLLYKQFKVLDCAVKLNRCWALLQMFVCVCVRMCSYVCESVRACVCLTAILGAESGPLSWWGRKEPEIYVMWCDVICLRSYAS